MSAYAGDASRRAGIVARLEAHIAAGEMRFDGGVWDGTAGLPTGCVVHSDDVKMFETETGMPACLGVLLNFLHRQLRGAGDAEGSARAHALAIGWMARPIPGADLSRVPSDLIARALRRERDDDPDLPTRQPDLALLLERAIALHDAARHGQMPARRDWTELRTAAVAAADACEDATDKAVGTAVEAICWNSLSSRSVLVDLAGPWAQARHNRAILASGWTAADQKQADACLEALWNENAAQREAGEIVDYPGRFSAREPELEARFRAKLDRGAEAWGEAMAIFANLALAALGDAT